MQKRLVLLAIALLLGFSARATTLLFDSFSYADGVLTNVSSGKWSTHSGTPNQLDVTSQKITLTQSESEDVNAVLDGQPYTDASPVHLYARFVIKFTTLPSSGGEYFAHFKNSSSGFRHKIFATTQGAASGSFRIGVSSTNNSPSVVFPADLALNTDYVVISKYVLTNAQCTLWINPSAETSQSVSDTNPAPTQTITSFAFRQTSGIGVSMVDDVVVATTFNEALATLPPLFLTHPSNQAVNEGATVTLSASATGTQPMSYQWQFNGVDLGGATNSSVTLTNVVVADAGVYLLVASNVAGVTSSEPAALSVEPLVAPGTNALSVVHYNMKGNFAADWSTNAVQVQAIARQLQHLNPDIVLINEIPNGLRHEMTNWITAFFPGFFLAVSSGTDGAIRSGVLSRYSITRSNSWLDGASLTNFGYNGTFTRDLFEAQIAVPGFPEPLHVFTTHLKSGQTTDESNRRAAEARAISNYFVTGFLTTNSTRPYLLTGDMNEDIARPPSSNPKSIQTLVSTPVGLRLTTPVNPYTTNEMTHSIQNTNGLAKRYDYILPCGVLFSNIASSQVFRTDKLTSPPAPLQTNDSVLGSDHLPVVMSFNNPYAPTEIAPSITTQPSNILVNAGHDATFSVTATGTSLNYQWLHNGTSVPGATESSFTRANAQTFHTGSYSVIISNAAGVVVSSNATLTVNTDFISPMLKVLTPVAGQRLLENVTATNYLTRLTGTASDGVQLSQVRYSVNGGPWIVATGTTNWSDTITVQPGLNTVVVKAVDNGLNEATASRSFTYVVMSPMTVQQVGPGTISSNWTTSMLEIGKNYKLTATVGAGTNYIFTNWTRVVAGGTNHYSLTNVLNFTMQSNLVLQGNFITNPFIRIAGGYNGLFYQTNGVSHHSAGFCNILVKKGRTYSGKLIVDGDTVSISGKFTLEGTASNIVSRELFAKSPLTLELAVDLAGFSDQITGIVKNGNLWTSELLADRPPWATNYPATVYTNTYAFVLPGFTNASDGPVGNSYGSVIVNSMGRARLTGFTADGQSANQNMSISKNGEWPLHVNNSVITNVITYRGKLRTNREYQGSLMGWVTFTTNTPAGKTNLAPLGTVSWIKTGWTNALNPNGFTNLGTLISSRHYSTNTAKHRVMNFTNASIVLSGGTLPQPITNTVFLRTNNVFTVLATTNNIKPTLTAKTGVIGGTFENPPGTFKQPFRGILLQDYNVGYGFFTNTTAGGAVNVQGQ